MTIVLVWKVRFDGQACIHARPGSWWEDVWQILMNETWRSLWRSRFRAYPILYTLEKYNALKEFNGW